MSIERTLHDKLKAQGEAQKAKYQEWLQQGTRPGCAKAERVTAHPVRQTPAERPQARRKHSGPKSGEMSTPHAESARTCCTALKPPTTGQSPSSTS